MEQTEEKLEAEVRRLKAEGMRPLDIAIKLRLGRTRVYRILGLSFPIIPSTVP